MLYYSMFSLSSLLSVPLSLSLSSSLSLSLLPPLSSLISPPTRLQDDLVERNVLEMRDKTDKESFYVDTSEDNTTASEEIKWWTC